MNVKRKNKILSDKICKTDKRQISSCFQGVLIPGGFGQRGVEGKIAAAQWARTTGYFLSECLIFSHFAKV